MKCFLFHASHFILNFSCHHPCLVINYLSDLSRRYYRTENLSSPVPSREDHDLIMPFEQIGRSGNISEGESPSDDGVVSPRSVPGITSGYVLRLFVSGNSTTTERTLQTLHRLLDKSFGHSYTLKVIDIFKHPEQAEANHISATPTLVRVWPEPVRRIVGDLENFEKVLKLLVAPEP